MFRDEVDDSYDAFMYLATNGMFSPRRTRRLDLGRSAPYGAPTPRPKRAQRNKKRTKMANKSRKINRRK